MIYLLRFNVSEFVPRSLSLSLFAAGRNCISSPTEMLGHLRLSMHGVYDLCSTTNCSLCFLFVAFHSMWWNYVCYRTHELIFSSIHVLNFVDTLKLTHTNINRANMKKWNELDVYFGKMYVAITMIRCFSSQLYVEIYLISMIYGEMFKLIAKYHIWIFLWLRTFPTLFIRIQIESKASFHISCYYVQCTVTFTK